jgi:integrating conjugative element protein (TIGR03765 family)
MAKHSRFHVAAAAWLLASAGLRAEPTVIHDTGTARPLAEYVEPIEPTSPPPTVPPSGIADFTKALFPVKTPELTPGPITRSALNLPHLQYPVFLVGSDALSRDWLFRYRDRLRALNAVGLLVEAGSEADYEAMIQLAAGLRLVPVSGSELAATLKLSHYPVLISKAGIEQ